MVRKDGINTPVIVVLVLQDGTTDLGFLSYLGVLMLHLAVDVEATLHGVVHAALPRREIIIVSLSSDQGATAFNITAINREGTLEVQDV